MNETLKDLEEKRNAVVNDFNDLYSDLQIEIYKNTIETLKEYIGNLEGELDTVRYLYDNQVKMTKEWQKQAGVMAKVKSIKSSY